MRFASTAVILADMLKSKGITHVFQNCMNYHLSKVKYPASHKFYWAISSLELLTSSNNLNTFSYRYR